MNWKLYLKPEMSTIYEPETIPEAGNEYYLISMNRKLYLKPEMSTIYEPETIPETGKAESIAEEKQETKSSN